MSTDASLISIASDKYLARQQLQSQLEDLVELGKTACRAYYEFLEVDSPPDLTAPLREFLRHEPGFGSRRFSSDSGKRRAYQASSLMVYAFSGHNNWLARNVTTVMDEGHLLFAYRHERERQSVVQGDDVPLEVRSHFDEYATKSAQLDALLSRP